MRLTELKLCKLCRGAGAVTVEGRDLKRSLPPHNRVWDSVAERHKTLELVQARDLQLAHPERQETCPQCLGTGWERDADHSCHGHAACRNHFAHVQHRTLNAERSLWRDLEEADARVVRAAKPQVRRLLAYRRQVQVYLLYWYKSRGGVYVRRLYARHACRQGGQAPGTTFTCFTGTKVQIMTQHPPLHASRAAQLLVTIVQALLTKPLDC